MKYYILVVMMALPGEHVDHFLYDNMPFRDVEECQSFAQQYWIPLTNLAEMKYSGKPWGNMFCIPEYSADDELIKDTLNGKGI